jgi:hypothetical protein
VIFFLYVPNVPTLSSKKLLTPGLIVCYQINRQQEYPPSKAQDVGCGLSCRIDRVLPIVRVNPLLNIQPDVRSTY